MKCRYLRIVFLWCIYLPLSAQHSHYEVLGVTSTATTKEIKRAFRKLAVKYHPDKIDVSGEAANRYRSFVQAYEVLKNPSQRESYDHELAWQKKVAQRQQSNFGFNNNKQSKAHQAPKGGQKTERKQEPPKREAPKQQYNSTRNDSQQAPAPASFFSTHAQVLLTGGLIIGAVLLMCYLYMSYFKNVEKIEATMPQDESARDTADETGEDSDTEDSTESGSDADELKKEDEQAAKRTWFNFRGFPTFSMPSFFKRNNESASGEDSTQEEASVPRTQPRSASDRINHSEHPPKPRVMYSKLTISLALMIGVAGSFALYAWYKKAKNLQSAATKPSILN